MLILLAFLCFFVACGIGWLAVFPARRRRLALGLAAFGARFAQQRAGWSRARAQAAERAGQGLARRLHWARRHAWLLGIGATVVLMPPLLAWLLGGQPTLPGYDGAGDAVDPLVAALLRGEQLAPPQALPPLAFTTREVEALRPMLVDASRNWGLLNPDFSQRLLLAFKIMKERHGYDMALLEGYRSPARQDMLARLGSQVTNARAFQSYHQFGLAADCAFWREGRLVISERDPWAMQGYRLYGEVAESLGLTWGGRWTMMDFGHTELRLRGALPK